MRKESEADIADIFNEALLMSYITMGFDQLDFREFELWAPTYKFILVRGQTRQVYLQYLICFSAYQYVCPGALASSANGMRCHSNGSAARITFPRSVSSILR